MALGAYACGLLFDGPSPTGPLKYLGSGRFARDRRSEALFLRALRETAIANITNKAPDRMCADNQNQNSQGCIFCSITMPTPRMVMKTPVQAPCAAMRSNAVPIVPRSIGIRDAFPCQFQANRASSRSSPFKDTLVVRKLYMFPNVKQWQDPLFGTEGML